MVKKIIICMFLCIQSSFLFATTQMPDKFIYDGKEYNLLAIEFQNNFLNIYSLGIRPVMLHTACYRGYIATFTINNNTLVLNQLYTNNGINLNNEIPVINGILPRISTPDRLVKEYMDYRIFNYDDINLIIEYTGYIIISLNSRENIREIIKLNFINGELINAQNITSQNLQGYNFINWFFEY